MNAPIQEALSKVKVEEILEIINTLGRLIKLNSESIQEIGLFTQSIAKYVLQLHDLVANINTTLLGVVSEFSNSFDLLELMQDSQMEFIKAIEQLSYFNLGLGVFNTFLIFVLGMVILKRR